MVTGRPPTIRPSRRGRLRVAAPEISAGFFNKTEDNAITMLLACLLPKVGRFLSVNAVYFV